MATAGRIKWDQAGERLYETGVEQGVLYLMESDGDYDTTVAGWNGLINVTESPSGAEATALWADNIKYLNLISAEEFGCTIEAYTYPEEFAECDGSAEVAGAPGLYLGQQGRAKFGFCYKTLVGNDSDGDSYGYKLHLIYGCQASPSEKAYGTKNDSPEAITFSWTVSTTPETVTNYKPTSVIVIDSTLYTTTEAQARLAALETKLYGADADSSVYVVAEVEDAADFATKKANLYIKNGSEYTSAASETYSSSVTYYMTQQASAPYLPKPDEVIATLKAS